MQPGNPPVNRFGPMVLRPQGYPWYAFDLEKNSKMNLVIYLNINIF